MILTKSDNQQQMGQKLNLIQTNKPRVGQKQWEIEQKVLNGANAEWL
ncbi:hypothetical protein [Sporolactobacillus pectinivorans]|nr:hypothetical protein [Sporolactobacillus pectinivorans]